MLAKMNLFCILSLTVMVATLQSPVLGQKQSRNRTMRMAGLTLNDWCLNGQDGTPCVMSGAECKSDQSSISQFSCKCKDNYEAYTSLGATAPDRCAPKNVNLEDGECEMDSDCKAAYGENVICRTSVTPYKCACPSGYIKDPQQNARSCVAYDCSAPNAVACTTLMGSNAVCQNTKCVCKQNTILIGKDCQDMETYECDDSSTNPKPCPVSIGTIPVKCLNIQGAGKRCVCASATGNTPAAGFSLAIVPQTNSVQCAPITIGGRCNVNDCPLNAECKGISGNTKGFCLCKPYFKPIAVTTTTATGNIKGFNCESAIGSCCRTASDCGQPPSGGIALACIRSQLGFPTGTCQCSGNNAWSFSDKKCGPPVCQAP